MGYLKRVILVNSGGYQLADVQLDGHCDFAGGQGVGKTTLMNAILFPFVVDDQYLDIDTREKERFSLYYFRSVNSFVIYEVVNNLNVPYSILINRTGQSLNFHFISAPFDLDWLYTGEEQVTSWAEVRQKLNELGINHKTEDRMWKFNSIFLGKGDSFNEQYSIVRTPKDRDAVRPLISAIFKNRPFTQENLKEILVAAVMSSNQVDTEGIELSSHKGNLESFSQRYSDIRKMTVRGKNGYTAIEPIAEDLFKKVDKYHTNEEEKKRIPGLLLYAIAEAKKRDGELEQVIQDLNSCQAKLNNNNEILKAKIQKQLDELNVSRGEVKSKLDGIKELEGKYKDVNINDIVQWISEKKIHQSERDALQKRYDDLTGDTPDVREEMKRALEANIQVYRNKELLEKEQHTTNLAGFEKKRREASERANKAKTEIEQQYAQLLGDNWQSTEINLIDALVELSNKLATAETVNDIRAAIDGNPDLTAFVGGILSDVLQRRNGQDIDADSLSASIQEARERIAEAIDRKVQLEQDKQKKIASILEGEKREIAAINEEESEEIKASKARKKTIVDECKSKAEEIRADYESRMHGGDESLKATLDDLVSRIESEDYVLKVIEEYPSAKEHKAELLKKAEYLKKREELNVQYNTLTDELSANRKAFKEENDSLTAQLQTKRSEQQEVQSNLRDAERTLQHKSELKAALETSTAIAGEQTVKDILQSYEDIRKDIEELKETIPETVRRLYGPDMLSRVDTFELGIGWNDSLSTFDEFLAVAEKLRTRLENSEENMGLDKFIRLNTNVWLDELRDISTAMSPVQNMLMQIQRLCRKTTEFVKAHNTTDCIDDFSMSVNEKDTTEIVRMLRDIAAFYNKNNLTLGFDNLFASEDNEDNKKAINLLEKLSIELERTGEQKISLTSMFDIRMDISEKGNVIKNLLSFSNPGSKGTAVVLKAMLNMTLLHIFLEKNQAENTRLICAIDEMNTIEASNLLALTNFATAAGMYIVGSGQHHTNTALDYAYNVYDIPAGDGTRIKEVSLDAEGLKRKEYGILG